MTRTVLVTGGAKGVGEAIARRLARDGEWHVYILDLDEENGNRVVSDIHGSLLVANITDPQQVEAAIQQIVKECGSVDGVVCNAGIVGKQAALGDYELDEWKKVIDVNLNGVFYTLKYALLQMARQETGGSIVSLSSTVGFRGVPNLAPYTASKWAIRGLTQEAAVEYSQKKIRVNAIAPTACETQMVKDFIATAPDPTTMSNNMTNMNALPGFVQPSDVANATAFLLSDEARYITGHTLPVDAGCLSRMASGPEMFAVK